MESYKNLNGNSNVECFDIGGDYIDVKFFGTSKVYRYSYMSAGSENVERMKYLARNGSGLNSFIKKYVNNRYE